MGLRLTALLVSIAVSACSVDPRTEVLVVADTDLSIPGQVDRIEFEVVGPRGNAQTAAADIVGSEDLPAVLGLLYEGGDLGVFQVNVVARAAGAETVRRTHRFSFVKDETRVLRVDLLRSCIGTVCGAGETCGPDGCRSVDVTASELEPWTGAPPRLDGSIPTDGGDAMVDGGDGGVDADAGCTSDTQCDDLVACTDDTCAAGSCVNTPNNANCTMGDVCDRTTGCGGRPCDDNGDCDDSAPCNGIETCVAMRCVTGPSPSCADGIACTVDRCDDTMGGCVNTPDDAACDDTFACTTDTCDAMMGCRNTPDDSVCDDTFACTTDSCLVGTGCISAPDDSSCALGELCAVGAGCTTGPTFTQVYTDTLSTDCTPCHTRSMPAADLSFVDQATAYSELVGVMGQCGSGNTLVITRDAMNSLLWRKVAGVDLCGSRMPNGRMSLPDPEINQIRDWINAGAANN